MVTLPRGLGGERGSREEGDGDSGREGEEEDEEEDGGSVGECRVRRRGSGEELTEERNGKGGREMGAGEELVGEEGSKGGDTVEAQPGGGEMLRRRGDDLSAML
jgi:hypothetical protein